MKEKEQVLREINVSSLSLLGEVTVKYSSKDTCFCPVALIKVMNGCYCRQMCWFISKKLQGSVLLVN